MEGIVQSRFNIICFKKYSEYYVLSAGSWFSYPQTFMGNHRSIRKKTI